MQTLSMQTISAFIKVIQTNKVCKATGLSYPTVSEIKKGKYRFEVKRETQQKLSDFCVKYVEDLKKIMKKGDENV